MKRIDFFVLFAALHMTSAHASEPKAEPFDAKMAAKASKYPLECNGPGVQPKPKMSEFVDYIWTHGLKDAKVECGVSNFGVNSATILIHAANGNEYVINFVPHGKMGWKTGEVILDAKIPEGMKRKVVWPIPKP